MTAGKRRRPRGTANNSSYVQVNYLVNKRSKAALAEFALGLNMSAANAFDVLLAHVQAEMAESGLPAWAKPSIVEVQEGLPLDKAS